MAAHGGFGGDARGAKRKYGDPTGSKIDSLKRDIWDIVELNVRSSKVRKDEISTALRSLADDIDNTLYLDPPHLQLARLPPIHPRQARSSHTKGSNSAGRVLNTPELLEHILHHLQSHEILAASSVNKTFRDTIEGSLKLQRALGLKPSPESDYFIPLQAYLSRSFALEFRDPDKRPTFGLHDPQELAEAASGWIRFSIRTSAQRSFDALKLGPRLSRTLVTQPPVKEMHVYVDCCSPPPRPRHIQRFIGGQDTPPVMTVTSETGVTIQDVLDAMRRVRAEHRLCPSADLHKYDANGFVRIEITALGKLPVASDDSFLAKVRTLQDQTKAQEKAEKKRMDKLRSYASHKRTAHRDGAPIPTLAEFEEMQRLQKKQEKSKQAQQEREKKQD